MKKLFILFLVTISCSISAQDRLFTYTYQSNVLNKGQKEIEVWSTMRNEREKYYRAFDHSLEFELGLGSKLQTSFYLNYGYSKGINTSNGNESIADENNYSFANEWKLKLSDPVVNPVGSAFYFEYKLATDEVELESKLIFDKQIGNTVHALNVVGEYAFINALESNDKTVDLKSEKEINFELNYAFAYQLNKNFSLGLEVMNQNRHESDQWKYSLLSAGPCLSYNFEGFWVNLSFMPQILDLRTGKQDLMNNEKFKTRLVFSYAL
ncbi:MAG: hypothetical protein WCG93_14420 [Paludibacter sp.]